MALESSITASGGPLAGVLRRAGWARLGTGFFAMCLGSALVAEALFGPKGPLWLRDRGTANAGGIGVGFAWVWAYFTAGRLARGRHWLRALGEALVPASVLVVVAVWIMRTVAQ